MVRRDSPLGDGRLARSRFQLNGTVAGRCPYGQPTDMTRREPFTPIETVGAELRGMMPWISAGKQRVQDISGG